MPSNLLPSNINDLFASFPELTTRKPTFSDADDVAFLAGLRQIAQLDQPKQGAAQQDPDFANKIIQLAINRTGKSTSSNKLPLNDQPLGNNVVHPNSIKSEPSAAKPSLSKAEIDRGKQDIETVNSDLKLLSTLLGRPISANDLPQLTQQFGGGGSSEAPKRRYPSSTSTTTTTTAQPAIIKEVELLQSLLRSPTKDIKSQVGSDEFYGNTDEAILATILKQKGIGPSHNNLPIEQLLGQNNNYYQTTRTTTTTRRPRPPPRQSRPILDGLSWLWRTWQDTAPGPQASKLKAQTPREVASSPIKSQQLYDDGTDGDTYT
ncbi:hypothetical protein Bhyg_04652 [Pseudolycoriella hygida]|uniref:Uncharacterized protein n=1 Tax=Pseudolycoriella hygida TaxID=35572 RepID=A0A9Q0S8N2_9DIPT|nr:hypothetical protein Bhyg_04652 [Pseudolycoriella hygida]